MKFAAKFTIAIAASLLMAAPALAEKDMTGGNAEAKAGQGEGHHGQKYGGHGRGHDAKMGAHAMMRGHGMSRGRGFMATFDSNGDGRLTQAEIDTFRADRLTKFDGDGNNGLNLAEYQALWLAAMRERMVDRFQDLDADGDGVVTVTEFQRPYANLVRHMDRNGDGVLTREHGMKGKSKKE